VGPKKEEMKEGWVYFVGATAEVVLESATAEEGKTFRTFRAFCEIAEEKPTGNL
jgi:mannose-6-phosphate isomerase